MLRHPVAPLLILLVAVASRDLIAQEHRWFISAQAVPTGFGNAASTGDPVPGEVEAFKPGSSVRGSALLGRRLGRWEVGIGGSYGSHGLWGGGGDGSLTLAPAYTLATADVTGAYALVASERGVRLQAFAGPTVQFWSGRAMAENRQRVGARGGLQLLAPVTGALSLDARAAMGLAKSPMAAEELSDVESEYETGTLWSRELGVGLRLAF